MIHWRASLIGCRAAFVLAAVLLWGASPVAAQFGCFGPPPRSVAGKLEETQIAVVAKRVYLKPDYPELYDKYRARQSEEQVPELSDVPESNLSEILWSVAEAADSIQESLGIEFEDPFAKAEDTIELINEFDRMMEEQERAQSGTTTFEICWIAKGTADLRPGQHITVDGLEEGSPDELYLLFGQNKLAGIEWDMELSGNQSLLEYVQLGPTKYTSRQDAIRYYFDYLASPQGRISLDARIGWNEIYPTDAECLELARSLPIQQLRDQMKTENSASYNDCLVAIVLGYVGNADDARTMIELFWKRDTWGNSSSLLLSFLRIRGEAGLDELDARFVTNSRDIAEEKEIYLSILTRLWSEPIPTISPERLKKSVRLMLTDRKIAASAIVRLAEWKDWTAVDQIAGLYRAENFDRGYIRKAIVWYLACGCTDFTGFRQRRFPTNVFKSVYHLNSLRTRDSRIYNYTGRLVAALAFEEEF